MIFKFTVCFKGLMEIYQMLSQQAAICVSWCEVGVSYWRVFNVCALLTRTNRFHERPVFLDLSECVIGGHEHRWQLCLGSKSCVQVLELCYHCFFGDRWVLILSKNVVSVWFIGPHYISEEAEPCSFSYFSHLVGFFLKKGSQSNWRPNF